MVKVRLVSPAVNVGRLLILALFGTLVSHVHEE
jgi:hypothetical protein